MGGQDPNLIPIRLLPNEERLRLLYNYIFEGVEGNSARNHKKQKDPFSLKFPVVIRKTEARDRNGHKHRKDHVR